jgi:hypothetical protein
MVSAWALVAPRRRARPRRALRPCTDRLCVRAAVHPKAARRPSPLVFSPDARAPRRLDFPPRHASPVARAVPRPGCAARSVGPSHAVPVRAQVEERRTTAASLSLTSRTHEPPYLSAARHWRSPIAEPPAIDGRPVNFPSVFTPCFPTVLNSSLEPVEACAVARCPALRLPRQSSSPLQPPAAATAACPYRHARAV